MRKSVDLTGWKYEIEMAPGYKVMFSNQYRVKITAPNGDNLTTFPFFGDTIGVYAISHKRAERKVVKIIEKFVRNEQRTAESKRSVSL
ncbi:hypothetical protein PP459_gp051 [Streptomyces phage Wakanda]|uniref:Uncharacterized protein n=2 Tax=Wakandavirus TaxID=3044854 RepID=A0A6G8R3H5_9CAUD|nr:hypothetical protein PP459_gp051 [Streptomyces phage Wakanda]YP_010652505.1 hypothetical protein PP460_gp053 [Streptomyces phage Muntaha]QIN94182.1 hypothetical protein SEA_WAKANDA_222 [Streptomyces phage Wakanda]QIN94749.1 hypothetical protein SEA_MUNTAHA_226 [Streptomyces phage Muntaha]